MYLNLNMKMNDINVLLIHMKYVSTLSNSHVPTYIYIKVWKNITITLEPTLYIGIINQPTDSPLTRKNRLFDRV